MAAQDNPSFARLVQLLQESYLEDGLLVGTATRKKAAEGRLRATHRDYLEALELSAHVRGAWQEEWAAGELQHCSAVGPDDSVLGLDAARLRQAAPAASLSTRKAVTTRLEQRLKEKCLRVLAWHRGQGDVGSESFQLAKAAQLPEVVGEKMAELTQAKAQLCRLRKEHREKTITKHEVCTELCAELCSAVEHLKLGLMAAEEDATCSYLSSQTEAMLGKLRVVHYQLLKGTVCEGQLPALKQIRALLEQRRVEIEEQLSKARQMLGHYEELGERLSALASEYRDIGAEIENKQWALNELGRSRM